MFKFSRKYNTQFLSLIGIIFQAKRYTNLKALKIPIIPSKTTHQISIKNRDEVHVSLKTGVTI